MSSNFFVSVCHAAAQAAGHRAYFKETLDISKCHQDVLHGNCRGLLLKYVATYAPKFSDSFAREWLNDEASAFSVARRVLFDYQPHEPEMWLDIFAELLPPCNYGGTMVPPYETSKWRPDNMSLLEFCRKTNNQGAGSQLGGTPVESGRWRGCADFGRVCQNLPNER